MNSCDGNDGDDGGGSGESYSVPDKPLSLLPSLRTPRSCNSSASSSSSSDSSDNINDINDNISSIQTLTLIDRHCSLSSSSSDLQPLQLSPRSEAERQARRDSYLPSWVVKIRQAIDQSRLEYDKVQKRLDGVSEQSDQLTQDLLKMIPAKDFAISASTSSSKCDADTKTLSIVEKKRRSLHDMPSDALCLVFLFLSEKELFIMEGVNRALRTEIRSSNVWPLRALLYFPCRCVWSSVQDCRARLFINCYQLHFGLQFLAIIKREQGVTRKASIEPHRYLRQDRRVTHPYPVFDLQYETNSPTQIILSPSETFTSDFRSYATRSLELINNLTSLMNIDIHFHLVKEGIVTVLISMLNNEMASLQSTACSIIANLLCFESYTQCIHRKSNLGAKVTSDDSSALVYKQLSLCNGHRHLIALLTSPSASLNVVQAKYSRSDNYSSSQQQQIHQRLNTSVQGVANQHSARALNMLFCRDNPIPSKICVLGSLDNCVCCRKSSSSSSTSSSGGGNSSSSSSSSSSNDRHLEASSEGAGCMEFMGSHFTSSEAALPWICRYFHKSGSLSERIVTYMRISPDGYILGRGQDSIGLFKLFGEVHQEIVGFVWTFHKTYVGEDIVRIGGYATVQDWAMDVDDANNESAKLHNNNDGNNDNDNTNNNGAAGGGGGGGGGYRSGVQGAHISHVGYWSPGVQVGNSMKAALFEAQQKKQKQTRNRRLNRLLRSLNGNNSSNVAGYDIFNGNVGVEDVEDNNNDNEDDFDFNHNNNNSNSSAGGGGSNSNNSNHHHHHHSNHHNEEDGLNPMDTDNENAAGEGLDSDLSFEISSRSGLWGMCIYGVWETTSSTPHFNLEKGGVFQMIPVIVI